LNEIKQKLNTLQKEINALNGQNIELIESNTLLVEKNKINFNKIESINKELSQMRSNHQTEMNDHEETIKKLKLSVVDLKKEVIFNLFNFFLNEFYDINHFFFK
jgi:uncharacterized coiled-coil DUF342 family protein